jgi:hypothetical protein
MNDYERWRQRQRRRDLWRAFVAWMLLIWMAVGFAFILWLVMVGLSVVFG